MSLKVMVWVLEHSEAKLGARLVLLSLAEYAHDDGTKAFPSVESVSRKARLSERGTRDALRKLEGDGMIVRTGATKSGTNVYTVVGPFNPGGADSAGGSLPPGGGQSGAPGGAGSAPDPSRDPSGDPPSLLEDEVIVGSAAEARAEVVVAWLGAPGTIQHRDSYFTGAMARRIDRAVEKYGTADLIEAIKAYAEVVESAEHWWTHRWTFGDFISRGLDKFVPEARPREVFFGKRDNAASDSKVHNERTSGYSNPENKR